MLHLAGCASFLTKNNPLDAAVTHRRGDLILAVFIGCRQRHQIESAKVYQIKELLEELLITWKRKVYGVGATI
jgi:hypothetical protein